MPQLKRPFLGVPNIFIVFSLKNAHLYHLCYNYYRKCGVFSFIFLIFAVFKSNTDEQVCPLSRS